MKNFITVFSLCFVLSACSSPTHTDSDECIEEANSTDNNGAQTSTEVYNKCMSAKIETNHKNDIFTDAVDLFFFEVFVIAIEMATN